MSVLLDTHVWLWWLTGSPKLGAEETRALNRLGESERPFVCAISLWEAQMLVSRRRVVPVEPFERWIRRMSAPDAVGVLPLDAEVIVALHALPESFHGDPADRLIVATGRAHGLTLATHDVNIRRSRLVRLWKP